MAALGIVSFGTVTATAVSSTEVDTAVMPKEVIGTSPHQEKWSDSQSQDSEYETASDLENDEEYDNKEDDVYHSLSDDDEDNENQNECYRRAEGRQDQSEGQEQDKRNQHDRERERRTKGKRGHKISKSNSNFNRQIGQAASQGKQADIAKH